MKEKIIIDNEQYEINILENSLFDNIQKAIDDVLGIRQENTDLYDLLGDYIFLITEKGQQKIDFYLNNLISELLKTSGVPNITFETEEGRTTIILMKDTIAYIKETEPTEAEISIIETSKPELLVKALLYYEITGGW